MKPNRPKETSVPIREHVYDGIQEYDNRLPNWWLYTLYIAIAFWIGYWAYFEWFRAGRTGPQVVEAEMARIQAARLAAAQVDDASLWAMSRNPTFVDAGRAIFAANCAACHLPTMRGKSENPTAIGPDLTDTKWLHGGRPVEIHGTIEKGILTKGMPSWGPVLGARKVSEVTAYILSVHREDEPILPDGPS